MDELSDHVKEEMLDRAKECEDKEGIISESQIEYIFDDEDIEEEFEDALDADIGQREILDKIASTL